MKRMTTIAQNPPRSVADGSYWGYKPYASAPEPMFHWLNTEVGTPGAGYHQWTSSDASANSSQDWVGYDSSGVEFSPAGYIFQNRSDWGRECGIVRSDLLTPVRRGSLFLSLLLTIVLASCQRSGSQHAEEDKSARIRLELPQPNAQLISSAGKCFGRYVPPKQFWRPINTLDYPISGPTFIDLVVYVSRDGHAFAAAPLSVNSPAILNAAYHDLRKTRFAPATCDGKRIVGTLHVQRQIQ